VSTTAPTRPDLSPGRRAVLAAGVVFSLALIAYGVLWLVAVLGRTSEERRSTLPASGGRLVVSAGSGDVLVVAGGGDQVEVTAHLRYGLRAPRLEQTAGADGVRLSADCGFWALNCSVAYTVAVPAGLPVEARSSAGDVTVRGLSRPVRVQSSAGDVRGIGLRSTDVTAGSSAGDVRLSFTDAPRRVEARTSAGDVELLLPGGGYRVDADSGAGDVRVDVPQDPGSDRWIRARSSAGDVRVVPDPAGLPGPGSPPSPSPPP
jgi:hypothetical protein